MATRSLSDVYILMRNNAIVNKNIFHDNMVIRNFFKYTVFFKMN